MKVECIIGILFSVTVIAISGDPDDGSPADSPHPDTLPLAFTVGQDRVVLNLTRTAVVTDQIPIYLGDDSGTIQPWSDDQNETFLVFTDDVTMATFILRETTDPEGQMSRQLRGTFDNEGELYSLEPFEVASSRMKRTLEDPAVDDADSLDEEVMTTDIDDVTYTVSRLNRTKLLDMQHDAVIRDDIEAINREPERILSDIGNDPLYPGRIPYEVELFLVLDYSVYRSWLEYSNYNEADAISNMRFYFIHILSGVNARYRGIRESDMEIYLDPVGIYIARTPGASAFTEDPSIKQGTRYTEAYDALDAFEEWINDKVNELPPFDQATLFTKNYLFSGLRSDGSRRRINGLADIKGVCRYRRASINYDSGPYGSVQTAAHELGHNLGADHDGYDNECVSRDQFIMATSPGALTDTTRMNPFHFSHCSIRAFRDYFYFLRVNKTNCLRHNAHTGDIYDDGYNFRTQPGQQMDVHAQCKLLFGSSSYYCGGGRYDTMLCQEMRCWDANLRQCRRSVEQRAAEGTTCGNYMWCSNGECVHDRSAPSTETETCIYGDYRGVVDPQTKWTCEDVKRYAPWRCYDEDLGLDCCASCSEQRDTQRTDVAAVYRMLWVTVGVCGVLMVAVIVIFTICRIKVRRLQKSLQAAKVNEPVVTPPDSQLAAWSGDNEGSYNNQRASQLESHGHDPYERVGDGASSVAMATFPVIRPPAKLPSSSRDSGGSYGTIRTSQIESSDPESYERRFEGAYDDTVAMVTVPVITPPAEQPSSSRDDEGSYNNLRASQIESRDPEPYERLGDGAHYDPVGYPETGVERNGGRHIYLDVE